MTSLVLFLCLFWPLQSHETSHCALLKISKCHNILILKCYFLLLLLLLHEGINTMEKEKSKLRKSITAGIQFCGSSCQRHWLILKLNQSGKGSLSMQRSTRELPTRTHTGNCCKRTAEPEFWSAKKRWRHYETWSFQAIVFRVISLKHN